MHHNQENVLLRVDSDQRRANQRSVSQIERRFTFLIEQSVGPFLPFVLRKQSKILYLQNNLELRANGGLGASSNGRENSAQSIVTANYFIDTPFEDGGINWTG